MSSFLKKLRKAPWVLGQRLSRKPLYPKSVVSDLFTWRCDTNWNTYFELLDIAKVFGDNGQHQVDIIFFDDQGEEFHHQVIELRGLSRQLLNISKMLSAIDNVPGYYGTFCVFHKQIPEIVTELQSFVADRGYVSYQYKNGPLRSYIHGNLDAIDNTMTSLGGNSFFNRRYNLQYLMEPKKNYEIALVNSTSSNKKVKLKVLSFDGKVQLQEKTVLNPKQVFLMPVKNLPFHGRLIIASRIIMARPVIFSINNDKIDVFHG